MSVKISELPSVTSAANNDILPMVQVSSSSTKSVTVHNAVASAIENAAKSSTTAEYLRRLYPSLRSPKTHSDVSTFLSRVADHSFTDIYPGDTVTVNDHSYTVLDFSNFYNQGENESLRIKSRHVILCGTFGTHKMYNESTDTNAAGFVGSNIYQSVLPEYEARLETDFPNMVLVRPVYLSSSVSDGVVNRVQRKQRKACLMSAAEALGYPLEKIESTSSGPLRHLRFVEQQFAAFNEKPYLICLHTTKYWFRDVGPKQNTFYGLDGHHSICEIDATEECTCRFVFALGDTSDQMPEIL